MRKQRFIDRDTDKDGQEETKTDKQMNRKDRLGDEKTDL